MGSFYYDVFGKKKCDLRYTIFDLRFRNTSLDTIWKWNNSYNYQEHIPLLRGVRGVLWNLRSSIFDIQFMTRGEAERSEAKYELRFRCTKFYLELHDKNLCRIVNSRTWNAKQRTENWQPKTDNWYYFPKKSFSIILVNMREPSSFKWPQEEKYWSPFTAFS